MPDYKEMYIKLFRSQTAAIQILQEAQQETEDMYIEAEPPDVKLLALPKENSEQETPDKKD